MSRRASGAVVLGFEEEVRRCFDKVEREHGLHREAEPDLSPPRLSVAYSTSRLTYRVDLDARDQIVVTTVRIPDADEALIADLDQIVVAAGLGPAQSVPQDAQTPRALRKSLVAQAEWVRVLHHRLASLEGPELMRQAKARRW